ILPWRRVSEKRSTRLGEVTHAAAIAPGTTSSHGRVRPSGMRSRELRARKIAEQSAAGASTAYSSAPSASTRAIAPAPPSRDRRGAGEVAAPEGGGGRERGRGDEHDQRLTLRGGEPPAEALVGRHCHGLHCGDEGRPRGRSGQDEVAVAELVPEIAVLDRLAV